VSQIDAQNYEIPKGARISGKWNYKTRSFSSMVSFHHVIMSDQLVLFILLAQQL
jgi:hypothetical protein